MLIDEIRDSALLWKESVKAAFSRGVDFEKFGQLASDLGLKKVHRIIRGKPNTIIILADNMVVRVPLDRLSEARCRLNAAILSALRGTGMADYAPRPLGSGTSNGRRYYLEERLPGLAIDIPISRMDELVTKAAAFITDFHTETAREITVDRPAFNRLFTRQFARLYPYLDTEYREKFKRIEAFVERAFLNTRFKTVWLHGDYKLENVLFEARTWKIRGIIDWDLSRREGLPLLDLLYLLMYKEGLACRKTAADIFRDRFLKSELELLETKNIDNYINRLGIRKEFLKPLLIMFFAHHTGQRYNQQLVGSWPGRGGWVKKYLCGNIDDMCGLMRKERWA